MLGFKLRELWNAHVTASRTLLCFEKAPENEVLTKIREDLRSLRSELGTRRYTKNPDPSQATASRLRSTFLNLADNNSRTSEPLTPPPKPSRSQIIEASRFLHQFEENFKHQDIFDGPARALNTPLNTDDPVLCKILTSSPGNLNASLSLQSAHGYGSYASFSYNQLVVDEVITHLVTPTNSPRQHPATPNNSPVALSPPDPVLSTQLAYDMSRRDCSDNSNGRYNNPSNMRGPNNNFQGLGANNGPQIQSPNPGRSFAHQMNEMNQAVTKLGLQDRNVSPSEGSTSSEQTLVAGSTPQHQNTIIQTGSFRGFGGSNYPHSTIGDYSNMRGLGFQASQPPLNHQESKQGNPNTNQPRHNPDNNSDIVSMHFNGRQSQRQGQQNNRGNNQGPARPQVSQGLPRGPAQSLATLNAKQAHINQMAAKFQAKLAELQIRINNLSSELVSQPTRDTLTADIRKISQDFNETQRRVQAEWDKERDECNQTKGKLVNAEKQLAEARQEFDNVIEDRKHIIEERDGLQRKINELRLHSKSSTERINAVEKKWQKENDELMDKLRVQEEQLAGKRALWLQANPGSSARRDAMEAISDPFNTPTQPSSSGNTMGTLGSPFQKKVTQQQSKTTFGPPPVMKLPPTGPAKHRRQPTNLPVGKAQPALVIPSSSNTANSLRINTEPGSDPGSSMAVVLHNNEYIDPSPPYQAAIEKLFKLVEDWAMKFANKPNKESDRAIASSNQVLWQYILSTCYPNHAQDSHTHAQTLLNEPSSRGWFIFRMVCQYCVNEIINVKAFKGFLKEVDGSLQQVADKLQERGLAMEKRQVIVNQQCEAVEKVIRHKDYLEFRTRQLNKHTKVLRDMVGPLLNVDCARSLAGRDLGAVVVQSWETSVKMNSSYLTFQIFYPETATKFVAASMKARDYPHIKPIDIQVAQRRVKLVVTPVITMRDDRGNTIRAKSMMIADVLLMQ